MSVSEETLEMIATAIKNGDNVKEGILVRSKLTNRLLWRSGEHDENDPYIEYLKIIGAATAAAATGQTQSKPALGEQHAFNNASPNKAGGADTFGQKQTLGTIRKIIQENKENWQDNWEILKKAGKYCSFCKGNREVREVYLSHNLKGPDGDITCPILRNYVCQCCGNRGHTIAYCPENKTGTSVLKMINRHNRI